MRKIVPSILHALLFLTTTLLPAQSDYSPHALGAKVIFMDYGTPNSEHDLNITNGIEGAYIYNYNNFLNLALPVKVGVANVHNDLNNRTVFSADFLLHLQYYKEKNWLIPYLLAGGGIVWENIDGFNFQIPIGVGVNIKVGKYSFVNVQGEYRNSNEVKRDNLQLGLGYIYRFGKFDRDGDGVANSSDKCPDVPGVPALDGCPDQDGDGIADADDLCPDLAGVATANGCPDRDGDGLRDQADKCPDIVGYFEGCPDQDGDGITDNEDQCPLVAGLKTLFGCPDQDEDGVADRFDACPKEAGPAANNGCPIPDTDGDGIADDIDLCPEKAGTKFTRGCPDRDQDGVADADDRCPDAAGPYAGCPDTDGDGVIDADDRCPEEAGTPNNKGCPEMEEKVKEVLEFAMKAVQFETGKATLKQESYPVLEQIFRIMVQNQKYQLTIEGHTDNIGEEEANRLLSEQRAQACYQYFQSSGIPVERLKYMGYGESVPLADNNTIEGRQRNRRVEFHLEVE